MSSHTSPTEPTASLAGGIRQATGVALDRCYQCGKCAAGCPVADAMDYPPSQTLRLLQHELPDFDRQVLQSEAIWLCVGCNTCHSRCPQSVDIPQVMDFLRTIALEQGLVNRKSKDTVAFHRSFLEAIAAHGRLYEIGLISRYKLRTGHLLKDMALAPKLYNKGKLELRPHQVADKPAWQRLFQRATGRKE